MAPLLYRRADSGSSDSLTDNLRNSVSDVGDSATDALSSSADQVRWWATTWFKSSAAAVGAVLLVILAALVIFVVRPWMKSSRAQRKLNRLKSDLLWNATREDQPMLAGPQVQAGVSAIQPPQPPPLPPSIPYRPGIERVPKGLGNTQAASLSTSSRNKPASGRSTGATYAGPQLPMGWDNSLSAHAALRQPLSSAKPSAGGKGDAGSSALLQSSGSRV